MSPKERGKARFEDGAQVPITIRNREVQAWQRVLEVSSLHFYPDNPRIYSIVRSHKKDPSQEDIEQALQDTEHVKELIQDIRRNGGLIDPLYVKAGTLEVIEGNCRLAALRRLVDDDPVRWGHAKCVVLPQDLDQRSISALLGQWHLKGKKEWPPYEQAGFLYRRHKSQGVALDRLAAEVGLSQRRISMSVEAYGFMEEHDDRERDHWSYYDEYLKSYKVKRAREQHPKLDQAIVKGIKDGDFGRAQDFRDWLPVICENQRVLKRFIQGDLEFEDAYETAAEVGGENAPYKKLKRFRLWLAEDDAQKTLGSAEGKLRDNIKFELGKIHAISKRILGRLG